MSEILAIVLVDLVGDSLVKVLKMLGILLSEVNGGFGCHLGSGVQASPITLFP